MTNVLLRIFLQIQTQMWHNNTFLFIVCNSSYDVIEHRHEDYSSLELVWVAHFVHELLDFLDELQCSESWEIFHSNSIGSPSIVAKVLSCEESLNKPNCCSQTIFDVGFSLIFPKDNTESENTEPFACERLMTSSSLTRDNCFHGESSQLS